MIQTHRDFTWEGVDVHPYKEDGGTHFKSITRQTLFKGAESLPAEFRYFEIGPGGHSTLERHDHLHVVMVIRGKGKVLVGDEISEIGLHDTVHIASQTWHQFQAADDDHLGFLCLVATDRDRPYRPQMHDLEAMAEHVRSFVKV
jgi:quercetin dioxygenase-like cupin family protein